MTTERQRWKWWGFNEMFALLDIWSDPSIQEELDGTKRNTHVYNRMSELLLKRGIKRSANQVREKMKTLKRAYWTLASKPKTILEGKKMILFERIEGILNRRTRHPFNTRNVLQTSACLQGAAQYAGGTARYGVPEEEEEEEEEEDEAEEGRDRERVETEDTEDDKHALHMMLSMGENPCVLHEEEERNSVSDVQEAVVPRPASVRGDDDGHRATLESPGSSLEMQCGSSVTLEHDDFRDDCSGLHGKLGKRKRGFSEHLVDRMLDKFLAAQSEMEKRFLDFEEQRMKEELRLAEKQQCQDRELLDKLVEMEERRRQEDRDHEMRLFTVLASRWSADNGNKNHHHHHNPVAQLQTPFPLPAFASSQTKWEFTGTFQPSENTQKRHDP